MDSKSLRKKIENIASQVKLIDAKVEKMRFRRAQLVGQYTALRSTYDQVLKDESNADTIHPSHVDSVIDNSIAKSDKVRKIVDAMRVDSEIKRVDKSSVFQQSGD